MNLTDVILHSSHCILSSDVSFIFFPLLMLFTLIKMVSARLLHVKLLFSFCNTIPHKNFSLFMYSYHYGPWYLVSPFVYNLGYF